MTKKRLTMLVAIAVSIAPSVLAAEKTGESKVTTAGAIRCAGLQGAQKVLPGEASSQVTRGSGAQTSTVAR